MLYYVSMSVMGVNGSVAGLCVEVVAEATVDWDLNVMLIPWYDGAVASYLYKVVQI
jgi:hypothetical protein